MVEVEAEQGWTVTKLIAEGIVHFRHMEHILHVTPTDNHRIEITEKINPNSDFDVEWHTVTNIVNPGTQWYLETMHSDYEERHVCIRVFLLIPLSPP